MIKALMLLKEIITGGRNRCLAVVFLVGLPLLPGCHKEPDRCEVSDSGIYVRDQNGSVYVRLGKNPAVAYSDFRLFGEKGTGAIAEVRIERENGGWLMFRSDQRFSVFTRDNSCGFAIKSALASQMAIEESRRDEAK
jgi:hypothetical protein